MSDERMRVAGSPNRRSSRALSNLFVWPRRREETGMAPRRRTVSSTCRLRSIRLIVRLSCHSFGFAPPRSRQAAWAHKPAILSNRNIKTILYNLQVKIRSQRGRDRRLQPLTSLRSVPPGASAIRATGAAGESSASRLKHCRKARRKAKPTPMALGYCVG